MRFEDFELWKKQSREIWTIEERQRILKIISDFKEYPNDRGWTAKIKRELNYAILASEANSEVSEK